MSHRSKAFEAILSNAEADLRQLLSIPETHHVLFLQGGASQQFTMVPMNFLNESSIADYVVTGAWGKKAAQAAKLYGGVTALFDGAPDKFKSVPKISTLVPSPGAKYIHFTSNETIHGVQFQEPISSSVPVICDMSSDILSRPVNFADFDLIYAGAQKNLGPAGTTVVILKDEFLKSANSPLPPMLDYATQVKAKSLYNTPTTFAIYLCGLVFKYWKAEGGLPEIQKRNAEKANALYSAIDGSNGFYIGHADVSARSQMNVAFNLDKPELTDEFIAFAAERNIVEIKGHRDVGGLRISLYNSITPEAAAIVAQAMADFRSKH